MLTVEFLRTCLVLFLIVWLNTRTSIIKTNAFFDVIDSRPPLLLSNFCQTQPYQTRVANADKNRAAHLTRVQHKASHNQDKALAAMSRRHMATGDASHFTVAATDDDDAVVQQQGWGYKPPMPARLQVILIYT